MRSFSLTFEINRGIETIRIDLTGRDAWALRELINAADKGCTPIDHPGPRWSAYVHKLRKVYGIDVETIHEGHAGPFPGRHARYLLRSQVCIISDSEKRAAA